MDIPKIFDSEYRFCQIPLGTRADKEQRTSQALCRSAAVEKINDLYSNQAADRTRCRENGKCSGHVTCHQRTSAVRRKP